MGSISTADYDEHARARWVDEPAKRAGPGGRTPFERDRARVLHSAALRRLAAKTQVVGPQTDDFVRNRLTHTLEVAQVARDLARTLGCDPDVAETAALAHDLGHPPFGHNGERALDELAQGCGGFEGNAQTLRILTRLEAKTADATGRSVGLNLTRATLDAATKYPWQRGAASDPRGSHSDGTARSVRKFGVYDDDLEVFAWLRKGVDQPAGTRCLEAQVMDLADDVAYSVHDLEDGIVAGPIDVGRLRVPDERAALWDTVRDWYLPDVADAELEDTFAGLAAGPGWPTASYDGSRGAMAGLKNLTSDLIGTFFSSVRSATRERYGARSLSRYDADLVVPRGTELQIGVLKGIAAHYVMRSDDRVALLSTQRDLVAGLVEGLLARGPGELQPAYRTDYDQAPTDAARLRVVVDQVAALTDASAVEWHRRLQGV